MDWILTLLLAVVMIGCLIGMLLCQKKAEQAPQYKGWAALLFATLLLSGGGLLWHTGMLREWGLDFGARSRILNADAAIYASQATVLAKVLQEQNLDQEKILLIYPVGFETSPEYLAFVDALAAAGVEATQLTAAPLSNSDPAAGAGAMPARLSAALLEKVANAHRDCKVVISAVGAPVMESARLAAVAKRYSASAQQWIFLEPMPDRGSLQRGLEQGNIVAACAFSDNPAGEIGSLPEAAEEIFALRYQLIARSRR